MAFFSTLLALLCSLVSAYAVYHSQSSIPKLRKYEDKVAKAAGWSSKAEQMLWDTRYTVGAGLVASISSFVGSIIFVVAPSGWFLLHILWAAALAVAAASASRYASSFWSKKTKVPLMDDYNDAISDNLNVTGLLDVLAVGWCTIAILRTVAL